MLTKKIYRFESECGRGMYCSGGAEYMLDDVHCAPFNDDDLWFGIGKKYASAEILQLELYDAFRRLARENIENWFFGFSSKKQLRKWVYKAQWLRNLHTEGMVISEYTCYSDDVVVGETQAVFRAHLSKQAFDILEYFKLKA